jgi:transposase
MLISCCACLILKNPLTLLSKNLADYCLLMRCEQAPALRRLGRGATRLTQSAECMFLSTGCQWRAIPKDLPPRSTVHDYLDLWSYDGTLDRVHHALYVECRERGEREARRGRGHPVWGRIDHAARDELVKHLPNRHRMKAFSTAMIAALISAISALVRRNRFTDR